MKKNMILVIILALLVVNIVLTAITMFSITSTNKKTAAVVADIATALSIEMAADEEAGGEEAVDVAISDLATYPIPDQMTIQLRDSVGENADGKSHYCVTTVVLSMNTLDPDYKTYGATISEKEGLIKNEINEVIGAYTLEEAKEKQASGELKNEVTARLQALYDSKFIYDVSFSSIMFQ
ncbi:MAG: flagellar basal body-associated FliL family protein [Lachnospiraceae bacterium]|nr:flagellar basal body-associated FliL family protein [Lachnospiraceae bacterium]